MKEGTFSATLREINGERRLVSIDIQRDKVHAAVYKENGDGTVSLIEFGTRILPTAQSAKTLGEL